MNLAEHRSVRMPKRWVALVLVLPLVLAGCGGPTEVRGGDFTIFVHGGSLLPRGGGDALVGGTLVTRGGCVLLEHGEGFDIAYPVIWPSGTSIADEDPLALRLATAAEITVDQVIEGGGGYHDAGSVGVPIPAECVPETGEVAVFNPDADMSVSGG
jgi:hypothetical protein